MENRTLGRNLVSSAIGLGCMGMSISTPANDRRSPPSTPRWSRHHPARHRHFYGMGTMRC